MPHKIESKITNLVGNINVPEFDPKGYFKHYLEKYNSFTCIITGSRMSGKSNMLKNFLISKECGKLCDKFDMIVVFSKTLLNGHYQKFLKTKLLFDTYKPDVVETLKKLYEERKKQGKKFKWLAIFDDCVSGMKWEQSITDCFYNGRHFGMSIFFLTQKGSETSTNWRNNTTLYVVLQNGSYKEKNFLSEGVIADAIIGQLPEEIGKSKVFAIGNKLQSTLTEDYNSIITTPYCKQKIHQYKAKLLKR